MAADTSSMDDEETTVAIRRRKGNGRFVHRQLRIRCQVRVLSANSEIMLHCWQRLLQTEDHIMVVGTGDDDDRRAVGEDISNFIKL